MEWREGREKKRKKKETRDRWYFNSLKHSLFLFFFFSYGGVGGDGVASISMVVVWRQRQTQYTQLVPIKIQIKSLGILAYCVYAFIDEINIFGVTQCKNRGKKKERERETEFSALRCTRMHAFVKCFPKKRIKYDGERGGGRTHSTAMAIRCDCTYSVRDKN